MLFMSLIARLAIASSLVLTLQPALPAQTFEVASVKPNKTNERSDRVERQSANKGDVSLYKFTNAWTRSEPRVAHGRSGQRNG
jgi:hypothetical protein